MANTFHNRSARYAQSNNFLTRSSRYVGALASFIEDTKPYHSKLTDVVEEYQFADTMSVKLTEATKTFTHVSSTWLYNYFSGGVGSSLAMPMKALHSPFGKGWPLNTDPLTLLPGVGAIKVGRDEVSELSTVPYVYSKQTFDGVADVLVEREGVRARTEPLYEGLDYFRSQGAFQFRVRQTDDAGEHFLPQWVDVRKDGIVSHASEIARLRGNDTTNSKSAISKVKALLTAIGALTISTDARTLLNGLLATVNAAPAVADYTVLRNRLITDGFTVPVLTGYKLISWVQDRVALLPSTSLTAYNTLYHRLIDVDATGASHLPWSNVSGDPALPLFRSNYEPLLNQLLADGTSVVAGYLGWVGDSAGASTQYVSEAFASFSPPFYFNAYGEFDVREPGHPEYNSVANAYATITNIDATLTANPADVWRIIAADAAAPYYTVFSELEGYIGWVVATPTGATFTSPHFSFVITHLTQPPLNTTLTIRNRNRIVFGPDAPLETWTVIKTTPTSYTRPTLTTTRYGYLSNVALSGQLLDTGYVVLTARADGTTFDVTHDRMPSFTGVATVGNQITFAGRIGFRINAGSAYTFHEGDRFFIHVKNDPAKIEDLDLGFGYDLDSFDNQDALYAGTTTAINFAYATRFTDYDMVLFNLQMAQNAVAGRKWRITAIPDLARPVATDVPIGGAPIPPEISVYYASTFAVTYSDNNFTTSTSLGTVAVGATFNNTAQGISFTLVEGTRPFIGVVINDVPAVSGGDVFSFGISNPNAVLDDLPAGLSSIYGARLMPHGDGFYEAPAGNWTVTFTSATTYTVACIRTDGGAAIPTTTCTLTALGAGANEGYSFKALGIHFTLRPGDAGFGAGDKFTFKTFTSKPTYLVHGSTSGWQANAVVGDAYWNGKIGFTIQQPTAMLHNSAMLEPTSLNHWTVGAGTLALTRLRFDAPNRTYTLTPVLQASVNIGWTVHASDRGIVGRLPMIGTFTDDHITLIANFTAADVVSLRLVITADDFDTWAGQDVIILNPDALDRRPNTNDFLLVDGRLNESLGINLNYDLSVSVPSITQLAPISIDPHYTDTTTGLSPIALSTTSPETDLLTTWLPLTLSPRDSATSIAVFSDDQTAIDVRSTSTGDLVGTLTGSVFTWDATFSAAYLPLNSEANIVIYNAGSGDRVRANITETLNFFISAGLTSTDYLLHDTAAVSMPETNDWVINIAQPESAATGVSDAQTGRFLAGHGNLPYDSEDNVNGYFDLGVPLTGTFMTAKELSVLPSPTVAQTVKLQQALILLSGFLVNNDIAQTELVDYLGLVEAHIAAHPEELLPSLTGFGYPESGVAFGSVMRDALLVVATNITTGLATAILHSNTLPIGQTVPNPLIQPAGTTYEGFSTPLTVTSPANVVQIRFLWTESNYAAFLAMPIPQVWVWLPGATAAVQLTATRVLMHEAAPVDYRLHEASWAIEVTLPSLTEAKIYLVPGP
jgi:hypothetical protein